MYSKDESKKFPEPQHMSAIRISLISSMFFPLNSGANVFSTIMSVTFLGVFTAPCESTASGFSTQ